MTTSRAPHAIIFDLDGTLVDTVGTRVDSWMAVFPRFGIDPDPAFLAPLMGSDGKLLARMVAERYEVELSPATMPRSTSSRATSSACSMPIRGRCRRRARSSRP